MALQFQQLSVDLMNGQMTISIGGQVTETGYANVSVFAPLPDFRDQSKARLEASAREEAIKYLEESLRLLRAPPAIPEK